VWRLRKLFGSAADQVHGNGAEIREECASRFAARAPRAAGMAAGVRKTTPVEDRTSKMRFAVA